ncbi:protein arginine N-methyltransferase 5 [Angomonas deanei]|nr:protein arginine N-methyltransferase 5 [Angomonas deanei]|eukprot:EPY26917.1 protein arginine N-methyltransferase 5 [Angomonas deanei]
MPAVLRHYGVKGEDTLLRALNQGRTFSASFTIVNLGLANNENKMQEEEESCGIKRFPFTALVDGANPHSVSVDDVERSFHALQTPSEWCAATCGFVTVPSWVGRKNRGAILDQLQLANFIGAHGVLVPLPVYKSDAEDEETDTVAKDDTQRNIELCCLASDMIADFLRYCGNSTKVWVACDACSSFERAQFNRLRRAVLCGYTKEGSVYTVGSPDSASTLKSGRLITANRVLAHLYFSDVHSETCVSTSWLGEEIVSFDVPDVRVLRSAIEKEIVEPTEDSFRSATPVLSDVYDYGSGSLATPSDASPATSASGDRVHYRLPEDIVPPKDARWAPCLPSQLSIISFVVELMRRRAAPVFEEFFFDHYALMNYLFYNCVCETVKDNFMNYEDVLHAPLQPLANNLSSGVYEVFERDASKYKRYRDALWLYLQDWAKDETTHYHYLCQGTREAEEANQAHLYIVILGCGRGQLLDECLSACSAVGVCAHIFAIEKNKPAAEFTKLRFLCEPEWQHLSTTFGHTLEVIVADGRYLTNMVDDLPVDFGRCDLVMSELLGSFGDNELSPECVEGFYEQLERIQQMRNLPPNPHCKSIPKSYTSFVAPLHSAAIEDRVLEAAAKGINLAPPTCTDRNLAAYHTLFVCNVNRGVALAPPQPCWSFEHIERGKTDFSRTATLHFDVAANRRCSCFVGYFVCNLYESLDGEVVSFATEPMGRTADLYSWFPCVFPIDLKQVTDSGETIDGADDTVRVTFQIERKTNEAEKTVWYTWGADIEGTTKHVMNEGGWAHSMFL